MARYKLMRKKNRLNAEKDGQWYAEPTPSPVIEARELCRRATRNTSLNEAEMRLALDLLASCLPSLLADGRSVKVGGLGSLRLVYGSEGVERPEEFDYRLIRKPRVVFRPSKELTRAVEKELSFELAGVVEGDRQWPTVGEWRKTREANGPSTP